MSVYERRGAKLPPATHPITNVGAEGPPATLVGHMTAPRR